MNMFTKSRLQRPIALAIASVAIFLLCLSGASLRAQSFTISSSTLSINCQLGDTSAGWIYLYHTGTDTTLVSASIIGTDAALFSLWVSPILLFPPRDTAKFSTGFEGVGFRPKAVGTYHAALILTDHATTSDTIPITAVCADYIYPMQLDSTGVLVANVGQQVCTELRLLNRNRKRQISISSVILQRGSSSPFSFSLGLPDTLAPGATDVLRLCYLPTAAGSDEDSLGVTSYIDGRVYYQKLPLHGFAKVNYAACVAIEGDSSEEFLYAGTNSYRSMKLRNTQQTSITINSATITGGAGHFSITAPTFPITIAAGGDAGVVVRYHAGGGLGSGVINGVLTFNVTESSGSCTNSIGLSLYKYALDGIADSTAVDLFPASTQKIDISRSHYIYKYSVVQLTNNSGSLAKIDTAYMLIGTYFRAVLLAPSDSSYAFYLQSGNSFEIGIELVDSTHTTYDDTLVVVSEHAILPTRYPVHAVVHASRVGSSARATAILSVFPNPSQSAVNINVGSLRNAQIEVLDILGRVVAEQRIEGSSWVWSGATANGLAPNGSYILRATGFDSQNTAVTLSTRITLSR